MTLRERNLVITCLRSLVVYEKVYGIDRPNFAETIGGVMRAIKIMKHVEIKGPGLPVSAGGDPETA